MSIIPAYTYTLTNGTTADANQVMANFNTVLTNVNNNAATNGTNSNITQLTGLTTPLTVGQGGTGLGTLTANGIIIGNGTSTPGFLTTSTTGALPFWSGSAWLAATLTGGTLTSITNSGSGITISTSISSMTNSLAADVLLSVQGTYFTGPSVAQGTSGTWFASGTVTLTSSSADGFQLKLWDGTTIIASSEVTNNVGSGISTVSLSGTITNPAGNIRISVVDPSSANGKILFNVSGNSKDSSLTVVRIG